VNTDLILKALRGNCNKEEFEKVRKFLHTNQGEKFLKDHFDQFTLSSNDYLDTNNQAKILEDIHAKINIEELIKDLSQEYKQQDDQLRRNRHADKNYERNKSTKINSFRATLMAASVAIAVLFVGYQASVNSWFSGNDFTDQVNWITKSTDKGQQLTIRLVDGTQVVLNANSSITYPEFFNEHTRKVEVTGEVYFEVAHDPEHPFVVDAGVFSSKVLGTSFNVINRADEQLNMVSLVSGKVEVTQKTQKQNVILAPGEEVVTTTTSGFSKRSFNIQHRVAWKNKIIHFSGADYIKVFDVLENWYGVNIDYKAPESHYRPWKLTAAYENESLEMVLNSLSESYGIKYYINGKDVTIKF